MSVPAANIGKARLMVEILPRAPFDILSHKEFAYYFTEENLGSMSNIQSITAIPAPLSGFRIDETLNNYDNYLVDIGGSKLEEALYDVTLVSSSGTSNIAVLVDSAAAFRAARATELRKADPAAKDFLTWQVGENLFVVDGGTGTENVGPNPAPMPFAEAQQRNDNVPKWTYNLKEKPDGDNAGPLSPFMTTTVASPTSSVHWGCKMKTAMGRNQPFEMLFYHEGQVHTIAEEAASLVLRFSGIDIDLTKKGYFALEMGVNTANHNYLFLFVQGFKPRFYILQGNSANRQAILASEFEEFSGEKMFNPENANFTVKVEPVGNGLVVTSNQFDEKPWVIRGNDEQPFFVGEGPLAVYSGNVQAGFAMRPIQYKPRGSFETPEETIVAVSDDDKKPFCTTAIKGLGDSQQNINSSNEVHAVDAEKVNGKGVVTFIESKSNEKPLPGGLRKINTNLIEVADPNNNPSSQQPAVGPASGAVQKKTYKVQVILNSSDVAQGNGYVVKNGRSPYIWQVRVEQPPGAGRAASASSKDISCAVMSLDLTWNSTSYNELNHTGSLKVLNRPSAFGEDFRNYTNRHVYFRISAWWEGGAGHDPGSDNRQVFEGMSVGATVDTAVDKETVTFKLEDYMNALEGGKFILSPFYDGMKASKAVRDIVKQAGVPDGNILIGNTPISSAPNDPDEFGLPFSNPLDEPQFRFKDGSSYKSAVVKIASIDGKTVYFDQKGKFHYDPIPGGIFGDQNTSPVVQFYSTPRTAPAGKYICWNSTSFSRAVNDTYNVLQVKSIDRDTGSLISLADANEPALHDPGAEGYLGYRKHLLIAEPALGSVAAAGKYFHTYRTRIFIPPLTVRFETFGYPGLKPLDCISLDGQKVRVTNISMKFDAEQNQFWMNVEGEWFFAAQSKWGSPNLTPG